MTDPKLNPNLISLTDTAFQLNVPYLRARDLMLRGILEGNKKGARWYVTRESVEHYKAMVSASAAETPDDPA